MKNNMQIQQTPNDLGAVYDVSIELLNNACPEALKVLEHELTDWRDVVESAQRLGLLINVNERQFSKALQRTDKYYASACMFALIEFELRKPGRIRNPLAYYFRMTDGKTPRTFNPRNLLLDLWAESSRIIVKSRSPAHNNTNQHASKAESAEEAQATLESKISVENGGEKAPDGSQNGSAQKSRAE